MTTIGVDGCRGGWVVVTLTDRDVQAELHPRFATVGRLALDRGSTVWIDIPIGLPDRQAPRRSCDLLARKLLGSKNASSVFPPPARAALTARDYADACRKNEKITGFRISKQTWNILPKIAEADRFLRRNPPAKNHFVESHPELCFLGLAGKTMGSKKTTAGTTERLNVLARWLEQPAEFISSALNRFGRKNLAAHDLTDALALALSCRLVQYPEVHLPPTPDLDRAGLPREIVFRQIRPGQHNL